MHVYRNHQLNQESMLYFSVLLDGVCCIFNQVPTGYSRVRGKTKLADCLNVCPSKWLEVYILWADVLSKHVWEHMKFSISSDIWRTILRSTCKMKVDAGGWQTEHASNYWQCSIKDTKNGHNCQSQSRNVQCDNACCMFHSCVWFYNDFTMPVPMFHGQGLK